MNAEIRPLGAGLYFVATPIGSARDMTLRGLDVLASADVLAAEDTRTLRKLMDIHGVALNGRQVISYHDHSNKATRAHLLQAVKDGKSVAYASEAGTPMVADPGFALVRDAIAAECPVSTAPGASAVIAALTIAGLPTDRFLFAGFAPNASGARKRFFAELADVTATVAYYESPKRIHKSLADLVLVIGPDRQMALCRELTKKFEEVLRGATCDVVDQIDGRTLKGEIVVLFDRNRAVASELDMENALKTALKSQSVKDAAAAVSEQLSLPKRHVYQAALKMGKS